MSKFSRKPLSFTQVKITDAFWAARMKVNREQSLDAVYQQLKNTGRIDAYDLDWQPGSDQPKPHVFWDSDVAKWLEGACYSLMNQQDETLQAKVEDVVGRILSAQGDDGYINPYYCLVEPEARWSNLRDKHELYCAGHLIEAAIAHHRATGDTRFLDGVRRFADLIDQVFGPDKGQLQGYPGHEEIELALVKLYRHTNEECYLELAHYFIEARGHSPHYFDIEAQRRGEDPADYWANTHAYTQSHQPVREQHEVVGHAVRAMYLYSGMADLALELGDDSLLETLKILWQDLSSHKLYLTGGIGSSNANEGFTTGYNLPNGEAYAETCAAIGLIFWAHRMLKLDLNSCYADVMERALYNGFLSGISLTGNQFFYVNPLASDGTHHRQPFFDCSCCPPNINRILPTIGQYIYDVGEDEIAVHLYIESQANFNLDVGSLTLVQETDYPWDGVVCIRCEMEEPIEFNLILRQPGWCQEGRVFINGEQLQINELMERGYISIERVWHPGDEVRLLWVMPTQRVYAHPDVQANIGQVALMRGPLVYCLEQADHPVPIHHLKLPRGLGFKTQFDTHILGGVVTIHGNAQAIDSNEWGAMLYRSAPPCLMEVPLQAIPYFAWDNRQPGAMRVWLPELEA